MPYARLLLSTALAALLLGLPAPAPAVDDGPPPTGATIQAAPAPQAAPAQTKGWLGQSWQAPPTPAISAPIPQAPPRFLPAPPRQMTLCGEPVPLGDREVAEMLDREFNLMVNDQAQTVMWLKRAARYFPYIEARLKAEGLPDDLKYVAVIESSLLTRIVSPAGAMGPWQFMDATGRRYGLRKDIYFDDRRNPERATSAAIAYLKDLYKQLGNWALSMASYNCGERRVQQEMAEQGVSSYYDLYLPQETMRYVFRVLAAKSILENPEAYGYRLPPEQLYQPMPADLVTLNLGHALHLRALAKATSCTVKKLKELNPEVASYVLPKGEVQIKVPQGQGAGLQERLASVQPAEEPIPPVGSAPMMSTAPAAPAAVPVAMPAPSRAAGASQVASNTRPAPTRSGGKGSARREWVVKQGESLGSIAKKTGVSVASLKKANHLGGAGLKSGQKLIIPAQ